jgi:hypothetical protein
LRLRRQFERGWLEGVDQRPPVFGGLEAFTGFQDDIVLVVVERQPE